MYDILIGKNIILRKAKESDCESIYKNVWGNEDVYKWMLFEPTFSINDAIDRNQRTINYQKNNYAYYIVLKDNDEVIGLCGIHEIGPNHWEESGICIGPNYQGNGYGKEVLSLLLDLCFNKLFGIDFRYSYFKDNIKSKKLAEHFNFKFIKEERFERSWDKVIKEINLCLLERKDYIYDVLNKLKIKDLQPSQLYISYKKLDDVNKWFNPNDLSNFKPIPLKYINNEYVVVDGHTRLVAAILKGLDKVPFEIENEEWDWEMYDECVSEAKKRNINSPYDLINKIISESEYDLKWNKWCDKMQENIFNNRLHSTRLFLRKWRYDDAPSMFKYCKSEDASLIAGFPPHKSIKDSLNIINHFMNKHPYCYAICINDSNEAIGCIELKTNSDMTDRSDECELGYWLGKPYWNNGYMTEASKIIIKYGFEVLKLNAIWCGYYEGNIRSKRVQEKIGFKYHHTSYNVEVKLLNERRTGICNLLTKEEYLKRVSQND